MTIKRLTTRSHDRPHHARRTSRAHVPRSHGRKPGPRAHHRRSGGAGGVVGWRGTNGGILQRKIIHKNIFEIEFLLRDIHMQV